MNNKENIKYLKTCFSLKVINDAAPAIAFDSKVNANSVYVIDIFGGDKNKLAPFYFTPIYFLYNLCCCSETKTQLIDFCNAKQSLTQKRIVSTCWWCNTHVKI